MNDSLRRLINACIGLFFPNICEMCGNTLVHGEKVLCVKCRMELPITNMHTYSPNPIDEKLAGTIPIERAAGYCHYDRESPYARLIQHAKYDSRPSIMRWLARRYAATLQQNGFFDGIDAIVPVPMYRYKEMVRGYNQAKWVARGFRDATGLPIIDNLKAMRNHESQTRRSGFARWENARSIYCVADPQQFDGMHLLLVDDVMTTGATLLACASAIRQSSPTARLSVATIAVARMS